MVNNKIIHMKIEIFDVDIHVSLAALIRKKPHSAVQCLSRPSPVSYGPSPS